MWVAANARIMHKLSNKGKLSGPSQIANYLSYTVKVAELLESHTFTSVVIYDNEYWKLQHQYGFRWGSDSQHLHTRFLVKRRTLTQSNQALAWPYADLRSNSGRQPQFVRPICHQFNSLSGCNWPQCRCQHVCLVANCSQPHPQHEHPPTMSNRRTWLRPHPCLHPSSLNNNIDAWTEHLTNDIDHDYLLKGLTDGFHIISPDSELRHAEMTNYKSAMGHDILAKVENTLCNEIQHGNYIITTEKLTIVSGLGAIHKTGQQQRPPSVSMATLFGKSSLSPQTFYVNSMESLSSLTSSMRHFGLLASAPFSLSFTSLISSSRWRAHLTP